MLEVTSSDDRTKDFFAWTIIIKKAGVASVLTDPFARLSENVKFFKISCSEETSRNAPIKMDRVVGLNSSGQ